MSDEATDTTEKNGRTIKADTGFYNVEVYGDPDDSFQDVMEKFKEAADYARDDVERLNDQIDDGENIQYR